ncbi:conserved hypothetical protein [Vibrio chagasii]|nr:conserved hypothetical protein [Vibrio chagasii]CAH6795477.1 conserved hypothetical protein [Vibrio chagasii]CAH7441606.1 conserved hypothetical protein [Vibrio chagasii]CAH7481506.1 conserved hypothetical protein [Vibrio chagasii]
MKNSFKILFIDDNDVTDEVESITRTLKKSGKKLDHKVVNIKNSIFKKQNIAGGNYLLDKDKIMEYLYSSGYMDTKFDIIACDFNFSDDYLDGYQLLTTIVNRAKHDRKKIRRSKLVFYTGDKDKLTIAAGKDISKLIGLNINIIVDRPNLTNSIVRLTNQIATEINLEEKFIELLELHSEKEFKSTYPKFYGKKLGQISTEIEKETDNGKDYILSLVEQTVSHMIELQDG